MYNTMWGAQEDGSYNSPYKNTIVYRENNLFERIVALVSDRAQLIPVQSDTDLNTLVDYAEHPSPLLVILGTEINEKFVAQFKERGFQKILMLNGNAVISGVELGDWSTILERVGVRGPSAASYLLDHVGCATIVDYQPRFEDVTPQKGKMLIEGVVDYSKLVQACLTCRGHDEINNAVLRGTVLVAERERMAAQRFACGTPCKIADIDAFYVDAHSLHDVLLELAPCNPNFVKSKASICMLVEYAPCYAPETGLEHGLGLVLLSQSTNVYELLKTAGFEPHGDFGRASLWLSIADFDKLVKITPRS